jgi:catechol 2,3-dioxygenase-like lactoylglutathione lyase family enzyme
MATNPFPRMHVSLYVSDIQKTIQFYSDFFGATPTKVKPKYAKFTLDNPSLIISFVENAERVQQNFGHLGFQVESIEDLQIKLWQAKKKNLVSKEEIGTNCCFAKQDKFWANDPDGVQWEVYYFHEDAEFNDPHYEMNEASACCTVSAEDVKSECGCNATVKTSALVEASACC